MILRAICFFVVPITTATSFAGQPFFTGLDELPGGERRSYVSDISSDGSTVVGTSFSQFGPQAYRWTREEGMVGLGDLEGGQFASHAGAVSADGSVITGRGHSDNGYEAFNWSSSSQTLYGLGDLPGGDFWSSGWDVSQNGQTIYGVSWTDAGSRAFKWTSDTGMIPLDVLPSSVIALSVSADESVIAGYISPLDSYNRVFRWTEPTGTQWLGDLPGISPGDASTEFMDISDDGNVIVGVSYSRSRETEAFRWTPDGGMMRFEGLSDRMSWADAVSGDGSLIAISTYGGPDDENFLWSDSRGLQPLSDVLASADLDTGGWDNLFVTAISSDGLTLAGVGYNPDGYREGWIAHIPEPTMLLLIGPGTLLLMLRRIASALGHKVQVRFVLDKNRAG